MKNTVDNKIFYTEQQFEIIEATENISIKEKIINVFTHVFGSKTLKSPVLTQEVAYVWPNVTETEYENWNNKPHNELPIVVSGRWLTLELPKDPHQKGEEILWI